LQLARYFNLRVLRELRGEKSEMNREANEITKWRNVEASLGIRHLGVGNDCAAEDSAVFPVVNRFTDLLKLLGTRQ
jgi:hypothetical protein